MAHDTVRMDGNVKQDDDVVAEATQMLASLSLHGSSQDAATAAATSGASTAAGSPSIRHAEARTHLGDPGHLVNENDLSSLLSIKPIRPAPAEHANGVVVSSAPPVLGAGPAFGAPSSVRSPPPSISLAIEPNEWTMADLLDAEQFAADFVFREILPRDVPQLRVLDTHLFPVTYQDSYYNALFDENEDYLTMLVFEKATNELVGVTTARSRESGSCMVDRSGYISTLGVHERLRNRKLGSFLLKNVVHLLHTKRNCQVISLHVKADNVAAIRMYTKHGFQEWAYLKAYYFFNNAYHDALKLQLVLRPRRWLRDNACAVL